MKRSQTVDAFIAGTAQYHDELVRLREILLGTGLDETIKWGSPCYMDEGKNIVGISAFKSWFALWFFQGALLEDKHEVLINAQEGRTRAMRQWRMQSGREIRPRWIRAYVREAVALQRDGKTIGPDRDKPLSMPAELATALKHDAAAAKAFRALTRGRQREYADYIAEAKREETRLRRLEKILPMIRSGQGLNDKYRS